MVCGDVCCEAFGSLTPDQITCNAGACECTYSCAAAGCGGGNGMIVNTCGSDPEPHCHSECNPGDDDDPDGDGLNADDESLRGTDPDNSDSDGDGLDDGFEVFESGTIPTNSDSDGDGISDGDEVNNDTNPSDADDPGAGANNDPLGCDAAGLATCNGMCADLNTDFFHCGECDNVCADDQTCDGGTCV